MYRYGSGALTLRRAPKGLAFSIQVVGGNAHTCALDGTIEGRTGRASSDVDDEPCTFTVEPVPGALRITPAEGEACRVYCGARASFDGDYQVPNPICTAEARRRFARLYAAKKLAEGRDLLRPVLEQCTDQLDPFEMMWVRNDLALGLHHLGDDAGCLAVLEPLRELADTDDDAPSGEPAYDEVRRRLAKATRTNLRLCGKPARL